MATQPSQHVPIRLIFVLCLLIGQIPLSARADLRDPKAVTVQKFPHRLLNLFRAAMFAWHPAHKHKAHRGKKAEVQSGEYNGGSFEVPMKSVRLPGLPGGFDARQFIARGPDESVMAVLLFPFSKSQMADFRKRSKRVTNAILPYIPLRMVATMLEKREQWVEPSATEEAAVARASDASDAAEVGQGQPAQTQAPRGKERHRWRKTCHYRVREPVGDSRRDFSTKMTTITYEGEGKKQKGPCIVTVDLFHTQDPLAKRGVQPAVDTWLHDAQVVFDTAANSVVERTFDAHNLRAESPPPKGLRRKLEKGDDSAVLKVLRKWGYVTTETFFERAMHALVGAEVPWPKLKASVLRALPHWRTARTQQPNGALEEMQPLFDPEAARWIRAAVAWSRKLAGHPNDQEMRQPGKVAIRNMHKASTVPIKGARLGPREAPESHPLVWVGSPGPTVGDPAAAIAAVVGLPMSADQITTWMEDNPELTRVLARHIEPLPHLIVKRKTRTPAAGQDRSCSGVECSILALRQIPGEITKIDQTDVVFYTERDSGRRVARVRLHTSETKRTKPDVIPDEHRRPDMNIKMYPDTRVAEVETAGASFRSEFTFDEQTSRGILAMQPLAAARAVEKRSKEWRGVKTALGQFADNMEAAIGAPVRLSSRRDLPPLNELDR